eukprot:7290430-Pyramimonas_sp.AAC.1
MSPRYRGRRTFQSAIKSSTQRGLIKGLGGPQGKVGSLSGAPCLEPLVSTRRDLRARGQRDSAGRLAVA